MSTALEQFLTMRPMRTRVALDDDGDLVRVETRKCDRTGLTLTRSSKVAPAQAYLRAVDLKR